jgi:hypothetical protein
LFLLFILCLFRSKSKEGEQEDASGAKEVENEGENGADCCIQNTMQRSLLLQSLLLLLYSPFFSFYSFLLFSHLISSHSFSADLCPILSNFPQHLIQTIFPCLLSLSRAHFSSLSYTSSFHNYLPLSFTVLLLSFMPFLHPFSSLFLHLFTSFFFSFSSL